MSLRLRTHPRGHIKPCLPSPAEHPPAGDGWLHEIKHDGFRILARKDAAGVRLYTRNGYNFASRETARFALPPRALSALGESQKPQSTGGEA